MPQPLFIGIDGGGTQCRARIVDAGGTRLGEGSGGPANLLLGSAVVMGSILDAARAAVAAANLAGTDLTHAHAGFVLAGTELPGATSQLLAEPHPFASAVVESDSYGALLGAFAGGDGAVLILGTGSAGLAVVGGERFRVAGYGAQVSDEASGMWLGREAIRRSLWAKDGRAIMSPLAGAILAKFNDSADEIVAFGTQATPADYGRLVPLVLEHAESRDPLGVALMEQAAIDATRMIERLVDIGAPSVSLVGGLAAPLSAWLSPKTQAHLSKPKGDAIDGAILMARRTFEDAAARTRSRA